MKNALLVILAFMSIGLVSHGNDKVGGGGADLKTDFIKRVEALIIKLQNSKDPIALDYAAAFKNTLTKNDADQKFKIDLVQVLIDPATGQPVPNQRPLYAYGAKNYIQLKLKSPADPGAASWEAKVLSGENIQPDVFHEMAWAATGKDADRDYQISILRLKLHQSNNTNLERLPLLHTGQIYYQALTSHSVYNLETFDTCAFHFEIDKENSRFVLSANHRFATNYPLPWSVCPDNAIFEYSAELDIWVSPFNAYFILPYPEIKTGIEILPDGNVLIFEIKSNPSDGRLNLASKSHVLKYMRANQNQEVMVMAQSFKYKRPCFALVDKHREDLQTSAYQNGLNHCKSIFAFCSFDRFEQRGEDRDASGHATACVVNGYFKGKGSAFE